MNNTLTALIENDEETKSIKKWFWMMDYCKKMGWSPASDSAWNMAENCFKEQK